MTFNEKSFFLSLLLLFSILNFNCESGDEDEVEIFAAFSAQGPDTTIPASEEGVTIKCGECVRFFDLSSLEVSAYFWDFEGGDPPDSESDGPTVCYKDPGKYDVALSVDAGADRITKTDFVCVLPKDPPALQADFSIDVDEIIRNQMISITDQSAGEPDSWNWTIQRFDNDTSAFLTSTEQNPSFTVLLPGSYDISLTVGRGNESDTKTENDAFDVLDFFDFNCLMTGSTSNTGLGTQHVFNDQDQIIRREEIFQGEIIGASDYFWNNEGFLIREDLFGAGLRFSNRVTYSYTSQGILNQQVFLDSNEVVLQQFDFIIEDNRINGAFIQSTDGQGGFTPARAEYVYFDTDTTLNVLEERITSEDGQFLFQVNKYDFDNFINPFFELNIQPWPARSFSSNVTRFTTADGAGNIFIERNSTFTYNDFGRAISESRVSGSTTQEFFWDLECERN